VATNTPPSERFSLKPIQGPCALFRSRNTSMPVRTFRRLSPAGVLIGATGGVRERGSLLVPPVSARSVRGPAGPR